MNTTEGTNMTEAEYRADPRMNVSLLVHGLKSMRHLRWEMDNPTQSTPAMKRGTMFHCYLLQPPEFRRRYVEMPAFEMDDLNCTDAGKPSTSKATKYYKSRVAKFEEENRDAEVITPADRQWCSDMARGVMSDPKAAELLDVCEWEIPLFGEIEGVACKGLMDLLSQCWLADVKTSMSVNPRQFGSTAAKLNYPFKLAFYRELARQNGYPIDTVYLIAVESKGPFDCVVSEVPDVVLDNAMDEVRRVLREYKKCLASNVWPGTSGGVVVPLTIPLWAMGDEDAEIEWSEAS